MSLEPCSATAVVCKRTYPLTLNRGTEARNLVPPRSNETISLEHTPCSVNGLGAYPYRCLLNPHESRMARPVRRHRVADLRCLVYSLAREFDGRMSRRPPTVFADNSSEAG
jgi:hypothetical protein